MIEKIERKIKAIKAFKKEVFVIVVELVLEREEAVLDLNRDEQLYGAGLDSGGNKIKPRYTASTVRIKRAKGDPFDRVTLRDEGEFHQSLFLYPEGDKFYIYSDDPKGKYLFAKYGDEVLGLTKESVFKVSEMIKEGLTDEFKKRLEK